MNLLRKAGSFFDCVDGLIDHETVCSMREIRHHFHVTCYDHSVFVSYVAFRMARFLGADYQHAARAGLLHDLFLYDPHDRSCYEGNQCFAHPKAALKNASALCGDLTPAEENSILTHMWPLAARMPRYKEAFIVNAADKLCAVIEVCNLSRFFFRYRPEPAVPF